MEDFYWDSFDCEIQCEEIELIEWEEIPADDDEEH